MSACKSTPISWLVLERHFLGELSEEEGRRADAHLASCETCASAFAVLDSEPVRPLVLPHRSTAPRVPRLAWSALAALAAAALLLLWLRSSNPDGAASAESARIALKGGGELVVSATRERKGTTVDDAKVFAPGDRFKVRVTCSQPGPQTVEVSVEQAGERSRPLGPAARLQCGNRTLLPGAFQVSGRDAFTICVAIEGEAKPACTTVRPASD